MTLFSLFLLFLKIGAFTFGGGYAMLPLMQEELLRRGVMDEAAIVDFLAVSESTPGPFAVNAATYVGYTVGGFPGALLATLGVVLPSFLVILTLAGCLSRLRASARGELLFTGAMGGLKPAVTGMIGAALLSTASSVFFPGGLSAALPPSPSFLLSAGIFLLSALLIFRKRHPVAVLLLAAALGLCAGYLGIG